MGGADWPAGHVSAAIGGSRLIREHVSTLFLRRVYKLGTRSNLYRVLSGPGRTEPVCVARTDRDKINRALPVILGPILLPGGEGGSHGQLTK